MHPCLSIAEIFFEIIRILCAECHEGTLAALALTCHEFLEPSLDMLWYEQYNLSNAIRCMPADLWEVSYGSVMVRALILPLSAMTNRRIIYRCSPDP